VTNFIIVEGQEDKVFIELLLDNSTSVEVRPIFIDKLGGLSVESLKNKLTTIKTKLPREPIEKVGIILDFDDKTKQERVDLVNEALKAVFSNQPPLKDCGENNAITVSFKGNDGSSYNFELACYLMGLNNAGELEDVLRDIKSRDSPVADCIVECLKGIKLKEVKKEWIHFYLKYDICNDKQREHASKHCSLKALKQVMNNNKSNPPFDLSNSNLKQLKDFLDWIKS